MAVAKRVIESVMPSDTDEQPVAGEPMVIVDEVHTIYRVYEDRQTRLREVVARGFRPRPHREIHALKGVSLMAHAGEAIGVIGRNGSGKSTLLQAIAGLLPVNAGAVYARYQPSLLGVGAALNPNLSGRRNIEIGCLALGMTRQGLREKFESIVEFSGLEEFIDVPMRAYSSGMKARLHFAVATAVAPEILLIDEALAVGDREFKEKSWQRIEALRGDAGTIFLVTHSLSEIERLCSRAIWLDRGEIKAEGEPAEVIEAYESSEPTTE